MHQLHQAVGDGSYIFIEPAVSYDLEKKINENGVHPYHGKKMKIPAMIPQVDPPITEGKE